MKIHVSHQEIDVKELTIGEIRAWLSELGSHPRDKKIDLLGEMIFPEITLREISMFTSLSPVQIEGLRPSQLQPLIKAICETNPALMSCRGRMLELGKNITTKQLA